MRLILFCTILQDVVAMPALASSVWPERRGLWKEAVDAEILMSVVEAFWRWWCGHLELGLIWSCGLSVRWWMSCTGFTLGAHVLV